MRSLKISKDIGMRQDQAETLGRFVNFCSDEIPIEGDFSIMVVTDRPGNQISTTACYRVGENDVRVYGRNRALVDVMRSIAHEMVHMMQDETGLIDGPVQDIGGFHEDQANSLAGALIKMFAKDVPELKETIYESKKLGQII